MAVGPVRSFEQVDESAVDHFAGAGWVLTRTIDPAGIAELSDWVDEVASWPDDGGAWLHHRELTDHGPELCRSENFTPTHEGLRRLLRERLVVDASALLREPAVLYKEKVNYKQPGGAGYAPHQDAPAYPHVESHVSCMVAVDAATVANGCLEVVSGRHHEVLPTDDRGCLTAEVVASLTWAPVEVEAGQTLWFHSRTPHRSGPNRSPQPRRALYPTYNARAEGDLREAYYREKLAAFADATDDGSVRVSLIGDFEGRPVR